MRRAAVLGLLLAGCHASHGRAPLPGDGGVTPAESRFVGRWLVDQPTHALYEATVYDLAPDGRVIEECSFSMGGPVPTGQVQRSDGLTCAFVGPWSSRHDGELAIEAFCDDSVRRTVVLDVTWGEVAPERVEVKKVGGEEEGWRHFPPWRWLPCARFPEECLACE
jgi:hypothetical protein